MLGALHESEAVGHLATGDDPLDQVRVVRMMALLAHSAQSPLRVRPPHLAAQSSQLALVVAATSLERGYALAELGQAHRRDEHAGRGPPRVLLLASLIVYALQVRLGERPLNEYSLLTPSVVVRRDVLREDAPPRLAFHVVGGAALDELVLRQRDQCRPILEVRIVRPHLLLRVEGLGWDGLPVHLLSGQVLVGEQSGGSLALLLYLG
jgi:hypothetical protein